MYWDVSYNDLIIKNNNDDANNVVIVMYTAKNVYYQ